MKWLLKIFASLALLSVLGVIGIHTDILPGSASSAQSKLHGRAVMALEQSGGAWASIELDGQKATLTGAAPSQDSLVKTRSDVLAAIWNGGWLAGGITSVETTGATIFDGPPPASPFIWTAKRGDGTLTLSGFVPSQSARDAVFQLAAMRFPDHNIAGALAIASGSPPEDTWLAAASVSLQALARLEDGEVQASDANFIIAGAAANDVRADSIRLLVAAMPQGITSELKLAAIPATIEETSPIEDETAPTIEIDPGAEGETPGPVAGATTIVAAPAAIDPDVVCRERLTAQINGEQIAFASASIDTNRAGRAHLNALGTALVACPSFRLVIVGHTDASGRPIRNRQLSLYRADAVAAYLRTTGVDTTQIPTRGAGASEPVESNNTIAGRARNRRIEFEILPSAQE